MKFEDEFLQGEIISGRRKKDFERLRIYLDEDYRWNFLLHTNTKEFNVYKKIK